MEKVKNDEKIKRGDRPDYYNQGFAFSIIGVVFLLLTIITSYETFNVLPTPVFFYFASLIIGMALFGFNILILFVSRLSNLSIPLKYIYIAVALIVCVAPFLGLLFWLFFMWIGVLGSWIFAIPYVFAFQHIPVVIFSLLMIVTIFVGTLCRIKSITISRTLMTASAFFILWLAIAYIWGHAYRFEGHRYDESLEIEGKNYHSIIYYGWLGDPGLAFLYECDAGYFGCDLIYETPDYGDYETDEISLVYDESTLVLRLEYYTSERNTQATHEILYEHPVR